jgi:hypothetical protein
MVIMVILMTNAPMIGNALFDARAQEYQSSMQRATSNARFSLEDGVMKTKRAPREEHHGAAPKLLLKLLQNEASLGILITGGTVLWLLIR